MNINETAKSAYNTAVCKGWFVPGEETNIPEKIAMIHSEASEALGEFRDHEDVHHEYTRADGKPEGFKIELADIVLRAMTLAEHYNIDLEEAMSKKMAFNQTRGFRHGGKNC